MQSSIIQAGKVLPYYLSPGRADVVIGPYERTYEKADVVIGPYGYDLKPSPRETLDKPRSQEYNL